MKVLIGTKNPGKIEGARKAFEQYFEKVEVLGIPVPSTVGDQPVNEDIYEGAKSRVDNLLSYAHENKIDADYYLGVESGITNKLGKWVNISVAVIVDKNGYESIGTSPSFPIPEKYVDDIIHSDLGQVMDKIFHEQSLGNHKGGISFLTKDRITRIDMTREAFTMALTQFINENIWHD